jgi:hypothetical protein
MNYDMLVFIVIANVLVTFSLWRIVARKADRPPGLNKKAAKELWHSEPITPKHEPPKVAGGEFASLAHDHDRRFFADFKEFADVVNWWLADEFISSRWRLQDLPDGDVRLNVDFSDGPRLGRSFAIFHNQMRVGRLEIRPTYEYSAATPKLFTEIELGWLRLLSFDDIAGFLSIIAMHTCDSKQKSNGDSDVHQAIFAALTKAMWQNQQITEFEDLDGQDWGELELHLQGLATPWYFSQRDALRKMWAERRLAPAKQT